MSISFETFDTNYLAHSWNWLHDPEIKRLTNTPNITLESQQNWFAGLDARDDYAVWGVSLNGTPIGVVGLKHIDREARECEYFGYIGEKACWGRGIGTSMLDFIKQQAIIIGLDKIVLKVSPQNIRAVRLYEKYGFINDHRISRENDELFERYHYFIRCS